MVFGSIVDPSQRPVHRSWLSPGFLLEVAAIIVAVTLAYGTLSERIGRLEEKYDAMIDDVREIRSDVKELLRKP